MISEAAGRQSLDATSRALLARSAAYEAKTLSDVGDVDGGSPGSRRLCRYAEPGVRPACNHSQGREPRLPRHGDLPDRGRLASYPPGYRHRQYHYGADDSGDVHPWLSGATVRRRPRREPNAIDLGAHLRQPG